jgi:hypothetical protein
MAQPTPTAPWVDAGRGDREACEGTIIKGEHSSLIYCLDVRPHRHKARLPTATTMASRDGCTEATLVRTGLATAKGRVCGRRPAHDSRSRNQQSLIAGLSIMHVSEAIHHRDADSDEI